MKNTVVIKFVLLFSLTWLFTPVNADSSYSRKDSLVYEWYVSSLEKDLELPVSDLMVKTALCFKGVPYVASTLDNNSKEELVVNLHEFDCTTFVETCIALTRTLKSRDYSFANFCHKLEQMRYRNGKADSYTSRLHYVSDWAYENVRKGFITDETKGLGGVLETKPINFMSSHFDAYKPLKSSRQLQQEIVSVEDNMKSRGGFYVLNKELISSVEDKIQDGDVIAFATSISGLDYSHIGIAYHDRGRLTFIHASTRTMKVIVEGQSLFDYCRNSKNCTGISVFRLKSK